MKNIAYNGGDKEKGFARDEYLKADRVEAAVHKVRMHNAMVKRNILHGDLSPNNSIIFDGRGYYIDFDHTQIIKEGSTSARSRGTGTVPYMSIHLLYAATAIDRANGRGSAMIEHTANDDLESLFYIFINFITT
ncbi:hypothetical protein EV702DRAFT_1050671 [Suillus placidus]|uniref:Protein kinase domain-containing protein n=1 Tax=Suillus placidus TaxID=48579 RepID=A0A9P7CVS1_9AGAM|nr:hypothetical protein EV702DRAFT_1050671 [Suillus placidus]